MRKYVALFLAAILIGSVSHVHAFTNGNSEKNRLSENFYPFGKGILEFQESSGQCGITMPNYSVRSVNASMPIPLLNIDGFQHNFFAVLGNNIDNSYHYFQIGLPSGSGFPSYLLDVKKDDKRVRGEFYVDYENLAVLIESDMEKKSLPDGNYNRYFEGESKDITANMETYGPDTYNFGAILLKSDGNSWIKNEKCAIHLDWPFVIEENGDIVVGSPTMDVGQLVDVTEEFAPLKQHRAGVDLQSIECKSGLHVILQEIDESGNKRPACVTLETKEKLIERGWANKISKLTKTDSNNNAQRLIELLESRQVSEFNNLKETMDLSRIQVSLEGADLHGVDLREVNLERVHIEHANLKDADLQGIVLDYRNIQYTNLQGANLSNAHISDAYLYGVNLQDADLTGANMKNTHVNDSNMNYANLQDADLRGVNFQDASLIGTNFQGAILQGALMAETDLRKINFDGANMQFVNLEYANLHESSLQDAYMQNANLENANLRGANLSGADLQGANLKNADLLGTDISNVQNLPISEEEARQRGAITG
ncbi:MAG: pentapeptide repeat-containing protein [Nitrosopumilus sp.]|nr:pentapeptide repeat-containing protein [Nitrosopumilus sp.]